MNKTEPMTLEEAIGVARVHPMDGDEPRMAMDERRKNEGQWKDRKCPDRHGSSYNPSH